MTLAFPVIGKYLAWRVNKGAQMRIMTDAITGCVQGVFLTKKLVLTLQDLGRLEIQLKLNMVINPTETKYG